MLKSTPTARLRAALLIGLLTTGVTLTTGTGPSGAAPADDAEPAALDMVVLVDQSGSLSAEDVARERQAVGTIAQSGLNARSRVAVFGFGSNNGRPGQVAVTEFCRPTVLRDDVARQYLAECSNRIARRTPEQGNDTDHAAALAQALSSFGQDTPDGTPKAVFLLTDGRLDVRNSPNYGAKPDDRTPAAQLELEDRLAQAARDGVQVWPLGFGGDIDELTLAKIAAAGAQASAGCRARPRARVVSGSADVQASLLEAYATAICGVVEPPTTGRLESGGSTELDVNVSPLATDGTIIVSKGDPRVRVEYVDPSGRTVPSTGTLGESGFGRSGENTPTEGLRVTNPDPGTWKVRLTAPASLAEQVVSATVLWQGALRSSIVVDPPKAAPGAPLTVRLVLQTRTGRVSSPEVLRGLTVGVTAGVDDGDRTAVPMNDAGTGPDVRASDGTFTGTLTAPGEPGTLSVAGVVTGVGVYAHNLPASVLIDDDVRQPRARLVLEPPAEVWAGVRIEGELTAENPGSEPRRVRLAAADVSGGLRVGLDPAAAFELPPGSSRHPVVLTVLPGSTLGGASLAVRVVDDADPADVVGTALVPFTVREPPGFVERHQRLLLALLAAVLSLLAVAWILRRRRRAAVDVRRLRVVVRGEDGETAHQLKPSNRWSDRFPFAFRGAGEPGPRLDAPRPGEETFTLRRAGRGRVSIQSPDGESFTMPVGAQGEPLPGRPGLVVAVEDLSGRTPGGRRPHRRGRTPAQAPRSRRFDDGGDDDFADDYAGDHAADFPDDRADDHARDFADDFAAGATDRLERTPSRRPESPTDEDEWL